MNYVIEFISTWYKRLLAIISPTLNTKVIYKKKFGSKIDLDNPKTLDEKIQWLKLNTYLGNPLVTQCADKYAVREYVKNSGCEEILNDLFGAYLKVEDIPWDSLPRQFVVKWNFGCGQNLIVWDKDTLDIEDVKKQLKQWYKLHNVFYLTYSEMQYKGIPPKLIIEKLIDTEDGGLPIDYKVYCFNGEPHCVLVCTKRDDSGHGAEYYFFDKEWKLLRYNKRGKDAPEGFTIPRPEGIEKVFDYAAALSKPFPFVRADFYLEKGNVTFGELTFTPCGGFDVNRLPETQVLFGSMVNLNYSDKH